MDTELLKTSIHCEIDFTTFLYELFPIKTKESFDFEDDIEKAVQKLKEKLSSQDFKKFQKLVAEGVNKAYPDNSLFSLPPTEEDDDNCERRRFLTMLNDYEHPPLSYIQELFIMYLKSIITYNLTKAFVEFYTFTNTLPSVGQVFNLYEFERKIQDVFKDYEHLHRIHPVNLYYLKESIYHERSSYCADDSSCYGKLHLRFCRYDTGE